jgi:hypothetical protein
MILSEDGGRKKPESDILRSPRLATRQLRAKVLWNDRGGLLLYQFVSFSTFSSELNFLVRHSTALMIVAVSKEHPSFGL